MIYSNSNKRIDQHDHRAMVQDFRNRFWIAILITIPILLLTPSIQSFLGIKSWFAFKGDIYILFVLSSFIYLYGGWPFIQGLLSELKKLRPGMMTLIAVAISTAYFYSVLVVFGLTGEIFFRSEERRVGKGFRFALFV